MQGRRGEALSIEAGPADSHGPASRGRRVLAGGLGLTALTFALDQGSKAIALRALDGEPPIDLVGSWLGLRLLRNSGAAFSVGGSATWVMTVIALVVTVAVAVLLARSTSRRWAAALGLVLGGSLGNLLDRFVREPGVGQGHVIDFIDYGGLFVGNLADIAIVGGALGAIILSLRGVPVTTDPRRDTTTTTTTTTESRDDHG